MKRKLFVAVIFITSLFYQQQLTAQWGTKGNGHVIKSSREISGITKINVKSGIDLYISTGDGQETCVIEADENLHDLIKTKVSGNQLDIYLSRSVNKAKSLKVYLNLNALEEIVARQGSDVQSINTIKFNKLNIVCNSGSDADIQLDGNEINCECNSGSDITLSGNVEVLKIDVNGGSDVEAYKLKAKDVYIHATSGSDAEIYADRKLFVRASSGSDVDYKGNPNPIDVELSSGADLGSN